MGDSCDQRFFEGKPGGATLNSNDNKREIFNDVTRYGFFHLFLSVGVKSRPVKCAFLFGRKIPVPLLKERIVRPVKKRTSYVLSE